MNGYARCSMALAVATAILAGGLNGQSVVMADGKPPASITLLANRIDQVIASNYRGPAVALATDTEFLRRIYLDLVGRSPSVDEARAFLDPIESGQKNSTNAKRLLIDDLLLREEFSRYYAKVLEVMFTERRELIGMFELRAFIRQWLDEGRPLNELCTEMLAADGTGEEMRAAAGFFLNRNADVNLVTRDIGRIFFGRDIQCAQCHDHPLVPDYKQAEYFGILSFVQRTYLFQDEKRGNLQFLGEKAEGNPEFTSVFKPKEGKFTAQQLLPMSMAMDFEPDYAESSEAYKAVPDKGRRGVPRYSRRQQLAVLATHPENLSFNRNLANRLWANMMGTGVVYPVDMHHGDNPPISAALLRLLTDGLVESKYDLRNFLRQIARSAAYQRSGTAPVLENWGGPIGGIAAIDAQLANQNLESVQLEPVKESLESEMAKAAERLGNAREDVGRLQKKIDQARKELLHLMEQRDKDATKLAEIKIKQKLQQELITSVQTALVETEKILKLTPADKEVVGLKSVLVARLKVANDVMPAIVNETSQQKEVLEKANQRVEDKGNWILALANRRLAFNEFVVEARGALRLLRNQMQVVLDAQTDFLGQKKRLVELRDWLVARDKVKQPNSVGKIVAGKDAQAGLVSQQGQILESWRRDYAIRKVRGLTPEQIVGATYTALETGKATQIKAVGDWAVTHKSNAAVLNDAKKRELFINTAVAANMWGMEKPVVRRFSPAPGSPQDVFLATVDQALMIQNDPAFQKWIKPGQGNLIERLSALKDSGQVANELYLSVLCRKPDPEEIKMVMEMLLRGGDNRAIVVQELVWGLLACSEFRFSF